MMQAVSTARLAAPARAARPAAARGRCSVAPRAAASLVDSTLASDHWSGGSPLILPNGTVGAEIGSRISRSGCDRAGAGCETAPAALV